MSKRSIYTIITPLPGTITRETAIATLHNHSEMIELNPLVIKHETCRPPPNAPPDEFHCTWYELTDKIQYMPGVKSNISYKACFHDLPRGIQTHVYAPAGLEIKEKWTIGGNAPGEPRETLELGLQGAPREGLYLREDVDMRCNIVMTNFVKKTLKKAHSVLVDRLVVKADLTEERRDGLSSVSGTIVGRNNSMLSSGASAFSRDSFLPSQQQAPPFPGQQGPLSPGQHPALSPTHMDFRTSMMSQIQQPYSPNLPPGFQAQDYASAEEAGMLGPGGAIQPAHQVTELPGEFPPPPYRQTESRGSHHGSQTSPARSPNSLMEPGLAPAPLRLSSSIKSQNPQPSPQPQQQIFEME